MSLFDVETEALMRELARRFHHAQDQVPGAQLLRQGVEDRDWKKVEQACLEMGLAWSSIMVGRAEAKIAAAAIVQRDQYHESFTA